MNRDDVEAASQHPEVGGLDKGIRKGGEEEKGELTNLLHPPPILFLTLLQHMLHDLPQSSTIQPRHMWLEPDLGHPHPLHIQMQLMALLDALQLGQIDGGGVWAAGGRDAVEEGV
jgi:hypothetical protein